MNNAARITSARIKSERLTREEQNMLLELANGFKARYGRREMVVARRLARKGLVRIWSEAFADGSSATWVQIP